MYLPDHLGTQRRGVVTCHLVVVVVVVASQCIPIAQVIGSATLPWFRSEYTIRGII